MSELVPDGATRHSRQLRLPSAPVAQLPLDSRSLVFHAMPDARANVRGLVRNPPSGLKPTPELLEPARRLGSASAGWPAGQPSSCGASDPAQARPGVQ